MTAPPPAERVTVRPDLAGVEPYGAPQLDVPVRLNTNETPYAPPPEFFEGLAKRLAGLALHRYPDRRAWALRTALGERFGLPPEQVWAASGSNEVLQQLFQAYGGPGRRVLLFRPGYSMHPLLARVALTDVVEEAMDDGFRLSPQLAAAAAAAHAPDLVCIASPNNPTGIPIEPEAVRALHDACSGLVVLDEAYVEFGEAAGVSSGVHLLADLPRLVVVRTFSKAWRLAGARLGYLLSAPWVIDDLRKVRLPYHLDALVQEAGLTALELATEMTSHIEVIAGERDRVAGALAALPDTTVWPSAANFLLFRTGMAGRDLFEALLSRGVLVRDFSAQPLLEGCLRVTIGTAEENDAFLDAMREVTS
jgi:histidinol-phosphate aminotransferase